MNTQCPFLIYLTTDFHAIREQWIEKDAEGSDRGLT
jgi:hypothetical protein